MNEGKRQKQVAGLIQEEINKILQRMGLTIIEGSMVSVSSVKVTPDLLEARIYFSVFNSNNPSAENGNSVLKRLEDKHWEIKKDLAASVKHQLRRIPELRLFMDDTLDHVFKMEEIFKQIKQKEEGSKTEDNSNSTA